MPIYEYQCEKCNHRLEMIQKTSDPAPTKCPKCGQDSLRRRISLTSFRLKGKGWYETDFKDNKKPTAETTQDKPASKESAAKDATVPAKKEKLDKSKE